jgi:hypothetical protein
MKYSPRRISVLNDAVRHFLLGICIAGAASRSERHAHGMQRLPRNGARGLLALRSLKPFRGTHHAGAASAAPTVQNLERRNLQLSIPHCASFGSGLNACRSSAGDRHLFGFNHLSHQAIFFFAPVALLVMKRSNGEFIQSIGAADMSDQ